MRTIQRLVVLRTPHEPVVDVRDVPRDRCIQLQFRERAWRNGLAEWSRVDLVM